MASDDGYYYYAAPPSNCVNITANATNTTVTTNNSTFTNISLANVTVLCTDDSNWVNPSIVAHHPLGNMNWLVVVVGGCLFLGSANWVLSSRHHFKGPKRVGKEHATTVAAVAASERGERTSFRRSSFNALPGVVVPVVSVTSDAAATAATAAATTTTTVARGGGGGGGVEMRYVVSDSSAAPGEGQAPMTAQAAWGPRRELGVEVEGGRDRPLPGGVAAAACAV